MTNSLKHEFPRPQLVRKEWMNLNGVWEFETDNGRSGKDRRLYEAEKLTGEILVPFCPESRLSGVENKDFMAAVWYRREFEIPENWQSKRVLLHFGAVDYFTEVWVNKIYIGKHRGGYTPFSFDITQYLKPGANTVSVCAEDDVRSGLQPKGKQSGGYFSEGCDYTRVTGIWQTVWLECVPQIYLSALKLVPDPENVCVHINAEFSDKSFGCLLEVTASYNGSETGRGSAYLSGTNASLTLKLSETHLWEPGNGCLYDLKLGLYKDLQCIDTVESYFGLRSISLSNNAVLINGKPVFQRLVLDQGYYPDGIYTAPSDEDLRKDIEISLALGFNGARMHQKVFEPRYIYWADKLGYLVWGEYGSWGIELTSVELERFLPEWLESVERDMNHPSLVGWCPFNETHLIQDNEVLRIVYGMTKKLDKTRPVIDTSGHYHVVTDIYDVHDYDQDPETFAARYEPLKTGGTAFVKRPDREIYQGQPYFVSEYGGASWSIDNTSSDSWGYGENPKTAEDFLKRYEALTMVLLNHPRICAFCYTQLYDIEQETNGLYTYDRKPKFDHEIIKSINSRKAAIEETGE